MATWEVSYEGPMRPNIDATIRRLRLFRDGKDVGAVDVLLDGPEVEGIARDIPDDREEARRQVRRAVVWAGARSLEGVQFAETAVWAGVGEPDPKSVQVADVRDVMRLPVDPFKVRALIESGEQLDDPEEGAVLHS